jgi:hypothetical protein
MGTHYLLTVRVSMGRTAKVKSHQNYYLTCSILIGDFGQVYPPSGHVKKKIFALVY